MDDWQLLQAYARNRSEAAFAKLISRHLDWVYSVAVRHVRDPHLAEDVAQSVFVLLARKAPDLRPGTVLSGWLFRTTRHVAAHARRAEQRRKTRETTACNMIHDTTSTDAGESLWAQLAPHLDQAVAALPEADRSAIWLRFYGQMPLREVGEKLGISDEAAKKRVSRALDRMRTFLERRGVRLSAVVLSATLAEKTVHAASATLAGSVLKLSLAAAATTGPAALPPLARETLQAWHWTKVKLSLGLAAASLSVILIAASTGVFAGRPAAPKPVVPNAPPRVEAAVAGQNQNVNDAFTPDTNRQTLPIAKTGAVTGSVVDQAGHPIAGARVWGGFCAQPFARDVTDQSGGFALDKAGEPAFVTVTADGFAADQQAFDPTNVSGPLVFRLAPIPALNVRVVDESGAGVAGVSPFLSHWWGRAGTLAQYLPQQTDADGRLQWLSPPKGELELEFGAGGYRFSRTNKFAADGAEHVIVLHPAATVTGKVTDAVTGTPVASFKFTLGHSQPWAADDPIPLWNLHSQTGSDGAYQATIEEEQAPFIRIEADGYDTVETAIQLTNGTNGVCDIQLSPQSATNSIRGTVLLPDGSPAAGVDVALCTAKVGVTLKGTGFAPGAFGISRSVEQSDYRRKTDEQGAFSFDPKPEAHTVVAVGPAGLGQARCLDFSSPLEIRLQPWGRIEGTVRTRDGSWANRELKYNPTGNLSAWFSLLYDSRAFSTSSDPNGNFVLENVPPGDGRVTIDDQGPAPILSAAVQVNPGETTQVQIGGYGQPVTGRLVAPPGVEIRSWSNQVTIAELSSDGAPYPMPQGLTGSAAEEWKLEFTNTESGRAWLRNYCSYWFKVAADGTFTLPEVLPGKYRLFVNVSQGYLGSGTDSTTRDPGQDPQIAFAGKTITVTDAAAASGSPMDLGDITLIATH